MDLFARDATDRWQRLIRAAEPVQATSVVARTPLARVGGISGAAIMECDNGRRYVVKGHQVGRALVADHVVGRLGAKLGAPVPEVALVEVPSELIVEGSYVAHFHPGVGHGSVFVPDVRDSRYVAFRDEPENAERFARLAVMYGWTLCDDRQFVYRTKPPRLVYSFDHGAFFGGPDWSTDSLGATGKAEPDAWLVAEAAVSTGALRTAVERLRDISDEDIASVVAGPPSSWDIDMDGRATLAHHLARGRDELLARSRSVR